MATTASDGLAQLVDDRIIYGHSTIMQSLNAMVAEIAKTDIPILLTGETGTGKEVYARLIHRVSVLGGASLKKVCCAALDAGRLLAEVREEFLSDNRTGEAAARTVFLDGVHELDAACQKVLLSLLPDGEPKGRSGKTALRFISSTSRDLEYDFTAVFRSRALFVKTGNLTWR